MLQGQFGLDLNFLVFVGVVGIGVDVPILVREERECWIAVGHRLDVDEIHKEYNQVHESNLHRLEVLQERRRQQSYV